MKEIKAIGELFDDFVKKADEFIIKIKEEQKDESKTKDNWN